MMQGHDGAMEEHPRSAVAHDRANLLPHITAVAVDGAGGAEGFDLHARAADDAVACVGEETAAVGAECRCAVPLGGAVCMPLSATVDGDHL